MPLLEELFKEYGDRAHFLFIYAREAHPRELIPEHTSFEQKVLQAKMLRDRGNSRQILVDRLYGDVHRVYGGRPNMSWILDHTGRVAYKASWTDANDIRAVLGETIVQRERKASGEMAFDFYREIDSVRLTWPEGPGFLGGERAKEEMRKALGG